MAVRPHIADAWRVTVQMSTTLGALGMFGFSVIKGAATFDVAAVTDLRDLFDSEWHSNAVDGGQSISVFLSQMTVLSYDQPTRAEIAVPMNRVGLESGQLLPPNVAAITSFRTDLAGSAHRGRCYIPGYTEASSSFGTFDATSAGHLGDFWADLETGFSGIGLSGLGVISVAHTSVTPVTSIIVEGKWATQRRRMDRVRG